MVHEIKTYPTAKLVRKKLRQFHPQKDVAIKAETEKILKAGFIYPVPLMEWVSNILSIKRREPLYSASTLGI